VEETAMRQAIHHALEEERSRWVTIFEIVSASTILLLLALVIFLVLTYQSS
jgi:hypothetical protein